MAPLPSDRVNERATSGSLPQAVAVSISTKAMIGKRRDMVLSSETVVNDVSCRIEHARMIATADYGAPNATQNALTGEYAPHSVHRTRAP
jgi:hypothetical protein